MLPTSTATTDIVPNTRDVALGEGWYPLEIYRGQSFRWVENDATVNVAVLDFVQSALRVVVEPGPGLGKNPLELSAHLADGTVLGTAKVVSKQVVSFDLPPESPRAYCVTLHADGGGKQSFTDSRILNFRVFEVAVERRVDVMPAWAKPGKGFYPLEHLAGSTFRWVSNDAEISLHEKRGDVLTFDVEPGPGLESKPFTLHVRAADGKELAAAEVASRSTVRVALDGATGPLVLHVEGGGKVVNSDPRVLNFRVFAPRT